MRPRSRTTDQGEINDRLKRLAQPTTPRLPVRLDREQHRTVDAEPTLELAALLRADGTPLVIVSCHGDIGILTIGRSDEADLVIADDRVSKIHARFYWDDASGTHVMTDCDSTNGTFVNRRRIVGPMSLLNGTQVYLGKVALTYHRPFRDT
jgi:pSer/pThr/pTyr-binding forkhead associated (FHA) protein